MLRALLSRLRGFFLPRSALAQSASERRQLVRVRCRIPVQIALAERKVPGSLIDLGSQGARLRSSEQLKVGSEIALRPQLQSAAARAAVSGRVTWSRPSREPRHFLAGVSFGGDKEQLKLTWVGRLLRELGLSPRAERERRDSVRVAGRIPVQLESVQHPIEGKLDVETLDVGVAGLLLRTRKALYPGEHYRCWIGPWNDLPRLGPLSVQVLSCRPDPSGVTMQVPVRLLELEDGTVRDLGRYVLSLLKESRVTK